MESKLGKVKKKSKRLSQNDDDQRPLSPQSEPNTGQSEASFDKVLIAAMQQTAEGKGKPRKKKGKRTQSLNADSVLESLKQGANLRKSTEDDPSILANTYDGSDSPRFNKNMTNEKGRKLAPKKGVENEGYVDNEDEKINEESPVKTKRKKKKDTSDIMDSGPLTIQELEDTPKKVRRKKKFVTKPEDGVQNEEILPTRTEDEIGGGESEKEGTAGEDEEGMDRKVTGKKKKKKMVSEDDKLEDGEKTETDKGKSKKKKRKKQLKDDGRVFGVTVHRTDRLKTDLYIAHPLVRVHIIDMDTGTYFKKSKQDRAVTSYYENQNTKVDYILPVLTQPYDFKKRKSIIPCWEEQLIFNESFLYLIQSEEDSPKAIIFYEVLDFVSMNVAATKTKMLKGEGGWHRIAWAFLKVVGANGIPNTDKKVRLQLFYPPFSYKAKPGQLDVYQWWLNITRHPYPSTLYVTVKAVKTPDKVEPAVRSLFATQEEQGTMTYSELKKSLNWGAKERLSKKKPSTHWTRLPGQMCRVPNKLSLTLAGDKKGCFVIKFSPSGRFLACGCKDREGYPVLVYEIPSGRLKCKFAGHYSLIYDICWAANDNEIVTASSDGTARIWSLDAANGALAAATKVFPHPAFVYTARFHPTAQHLVISGGYDKVVRVWSATNDMQTGELLQELDGHKGFVNCLCFSQDGKTMFSGDSLGVIIKWNALVMAKAATSAHQVTFGSAGQSLENTGTTSKAIGQKIGGILKDTGSADKFSVEKIIAEKELEGVTINCLEVHPSGRRILIHGRDNHIRMMDLRLFTVMQRYLGALNFREHVRSTMTECGSFVIAGSEDCQAFVWNTDTGEQIASYSNMGYSYPVTAVDYHPYEHMVAFASRGEGHPVKVYVYDAKVAQLDAGIQSTAVGKDQAEPSSTVAKSEKALAGLLEAKQELKDELDTTKTLRMERVKAKLASVVANQHKALDQQQLQQSMLGGSYVFPPGGATPMQQTLSTWGSTFDASKFMSQSVLGPRMPSPTPAQLESPGVSSFLASQSARGMRSMGMTMGGTGWMPPRSYFPRADTPNIALQTGQGGTAKFSFHASSTQKNKTDYRRVVALYDYTAQRSDELSLRQGDWISVLHEDNENWWMGQLENGQQGYFPANYVADEHLQEQETTLGERAPSETNGDISGIEELNEVDSAATTPRRKSRTRKGGSKMTAVITKSGDLKILSGAEDSDDVELKPVTSQRRKKRTLSREPVTDRTDDRNDRTEAETTPRRQRTRTRSQSSQRRRLAEDLDAGIPPKPPKSRSRTTDDTILTSNRDLQGTSRTPRRGGKTVSNEDLSSQAALDEGEPRTPKPRKKRSKDAALSDGDQTGKRTPRLTKTPSRELLLNGSAETEPRTPGEKKSGKRKQKINHTERMT